MITHVHEEHESSKPGRKLVGTSEPDFNQAISPVVAEFIFQASKVLTKFREEWMADHQDDNFATGLEIDIVPILTDGFVMGFLGISEIDGKSYDYAPTKGSALEEVDK